MKKVLLLIAVVAAGFTANAQEVKFGAKAGLNIASISGDTDDLGNTSARTSFHVGAVAEITISDKFAIQPELVYSTQGTKLELREADGTMKLDYLNVPVIAKFYVAEGLSLEAGPQIGFLMSAKLKAEYGGETEETDIKDELEIKSVDFGLNFGAGYKLDNGLNFSARYNLGLSEISKNENIDSKNGVFQISVGYMF